VPFPCSDTSGEEIVLTVGAWDDRRRTDDRGRRERAIQAYSKIAEQIKKEDELVNQRLTWGASINGALLALLGVGGGLFKDFTFAILRKCDSAALRLVMAADGLGCVETLCRKCRSVAVLVGWR